MHHALTIAASCLATIVCGASTSFAAASAAGGHDTPHSLKPFLRTYLSKGPGNSGSTRVSIVGAHLGGRGHQALAYLNGTDWCGSGGCTLLVLESGRGGWKVIGHVTIARPPILRLRRTSHGYRDLATFVEGGGIIPGYEADLPFNGRRYAGNPSVPPARPLKGEPQGDVLIATDAPSEALYD